MQHNSILFNSVFSWYSLNLDIPNARVVSLSLVKNSTSQTRGRALKETKKRRRKMLIYLHNNINVHLNLFLYKLFIY